MKIIKRDDIGELHLPGRVIQKAVGKEGAVSPSTEMTFGYAHYSAESGPMEPHHHAEEIVHVLSVRDGWVRCGAEKDHLDTKVTLQAGMTLHIPALEWHVFEFGSGGHVDILFFYGKKDLFSEQAAGGQ
jgi:mannose-6-phosphate isomerase-like protein (cupin superfamily)